MEDCRHPCCYVTGQGCDGQGCHGSCFGLTFLPCFFVAGMPTQANQLNWSGPRWYAKGMHAIKRNDETGLRRIVDGAGWKPDNAKKTPQKKPEVQVQAQNQVNAALIWPAQAAYNAQMAKLLGVAEQKPESETARMSALAGAEMAENKVIYSSAFAKVEKANSKESMQDLYDFVERLIVNVQSEVPTRPETKLKSKRDVAGMLTVGIWTFKSFKKSFKAMQQIPGVTVSMPSNPFLKRVYRLLQKMALRGGSCASIADVVRGLVTVNTTDEFVAVLKYLKTRSGGKIVDVKSRLRRTDHSEGGWSDCIVILQFTNEDGSIGFAEV